MPVTATLSREFYDRFGDKLVGELVGLLNDVDATFKADLREQHDRILTLFDAKLEQRFAKFKLELKLEQRLAELKAEIEQRLSELRAELGQQIVELRAEFKQEIAELKAELIKWMFLFWLGTVATMLGFGRLLFGG
jgi:DNA anti-recombination protein RmuC